MATSLASLLMALDSNDTCMHVQLGSRSAERLAVRRRRRIQKIRRRRVLLEGSRNCRGRFGRRIRDLRRLVPTGESVIGVDGLFKEAAEYISYLRMQVEVMQVLVKVLSGDSED
ncbi:uncharacterized protein A4U43_C07F12740 [Asparagus officinalis]|uniref:BHLH domain-containing protein n=1 Tax=Asparagus officinalis TaxID=4686 RepID=A0A5P1EEU7_ASPOF|nr:uncharacterized protein A4U43_C07F12740 [Asparagus officinalis]